METNKPPTTTELAVLGLIAFRESSGYDLAREAERSIGHMWAPSRSQIYKVLPRLVAAGYVRSREVEQHGRPDKALYRITPTGRAALRAWIADVVPDPSGGNMVFLLKVFLGWNGSPDAVLEQLRAYRALLERRLAEYEALDASLSPDDPPHSRIALHHGIARAHATIGWADEAERELRRG